VGEEVNRELFKKVYDQIAEHPDTHWQGDFEADVEDGAGGYREDGVPVCGTTRCVAGWALHFSGQRVNDSLDPGRDAARLLGLSVDAASVLFSGSLPETEAVALVRFYAGL
jgi:hypothetical protein